MTEQQPTPRTLVSSPAHGPSATPGVDLWMTWLDRPSSGDEDALDLLDGRERARAERFHGTRDRARYVARHAWVRRIVSGYTGQAAAMVAITVTPAGRPGLDPSWGIDLGMSHSDGLALLAVTRAGRVGVDVERVRHLEDALELAGTHATRRESAELAAFPREARSHAFLRLWTRKEAVVKALGTGLVTPLDGFDTGTLAHDDPRRTAGSADLLLEGLRLPDGFVGTVAVDAPTVALRYMRRSAVAA